jgi:predicted Zn-dependent protease with MMP-like domain
MDVGHEQFRELVVTALDELPAEWRGALEEIVVLVEDQVSDEDLLDAGFDGSDGSDLLGLYVGIPLTERGAMDAGLPDRIMIYRLPILAICDTQADVMREVQHTVLHELGHHFGLLEDDLPF